MGQTDLWRLQELGVLANPNLSLLEYDATDPVSSLRLVEASSPEEIYHMAARAHVGRSFQTPHATTLATGIGALNMLEATRKLAPAARFLQASSAELYGNTLISPQNEETPFKPRSPYGAAKLYAYSLAVNYFEAYGLFRRERNFFQLRVALTVDGICHPQNNVWSRRFRRSWSRAVIAWELSRQTRLGISERVC
jgi:GDP-mannose 4,6-dehydratase